MKTRPNRPQLSPPALLAAACALAAFAAAGVRSISAPPAPAPASAPTPAIQIHQSLARQTVTTDAPGQTRQTWQPLADSATVQPGDILRGTQRVENTGRRPVQNFVLTQPIASGLEYVPSSAAITGADGVQITFKVDGAAGWSANPTVAVLGPDGTTKRVPAPASSYRAVRWTFTLPIPAGASAQAALVEKVR